MLRSMRRKHDPSRDAADRVSLKMDKPCLEMKIINSVKGRGVFAKEFIANGEFVVEYRGTLLTQQEGDLCAKRYDESERVFLFDFQWNGKMWCIDASKEDGSLGRLINDEFKNPNLKMKIISVNNLPHLCLFSIRDIFVNEELTYNYGNSDWPWRTQITKVQQCDKQTDRSLQCPETFQPSPTVENSSELCSRPVQEQIIQVTTGQQSDNQTDYTQQHTGTFQMSPTLRNSSEVCCPPAQEGSFQANMEKYRKHHNICPTRSYLSTQERNAIEHQRTILLQQLTDLNQMLEVKSLVSIPESMDTAVQPPNDSQLLSEMDNTRVPCMGMVPPPLERTESVFLTKEMLGYESESPMESSDATLFANESQREHESSSTYLTVLTDQGSTSKVIPRERGQPAKQMLGHDSKSFCSINICEDEYLQRAWSGSESSFGDPPELKNRTKRRSSRKHDNITKVPEHDSESISSIEITEDEYVPCSGSESESSIESFKEIEEKFTKQRLKHKSLLRTYKKRRNTESDTSPTESTSSYTVMHSLKKADGSRIYNKRHYCLYCQKSQSKIARHLELVHGKESEVAKALIFPKNSRGRKLQLNSLRRRGDREHNVEVIKEGKGVIVPCKQSSTPNANPKDFLHCANCQGLFKRQFLWKHMKRCPMTYGISVKPGRTRVQSICANAQPVPEGVSKGVWKLISNMKQDEIANIVRDDRYIIQFGEQHFNLMGHNPANHELIRQKMRELGRLVLRGRQMTPLIKIEEYIDPANFHHTVNAVKAVSGFNCENNTLKIASLALKLGQSLQKIADILSCEARISGNKSKVRRVEDFKHVYKTRWRECISAHAHKTLEEKKYNSPLLLPFTNDVKKLHTYLEEHQQIYSCKLAVEPKSETWAKLAKVTLAQMIVFNRRRQGEASLMKVASFLSRDTSALHGDVADALSNVEKALCQHFSRVEIRGKRSRKVSVLLSPTMVKSMELLVEKRESCDVLKENEYMFAIPGCITAFRGSDCLRFCAKECGAQHPECLSSTKLRKHVSTMSRVLNLNDTEMDQLADFLGHDIRVHRKFYRLPEGTLQLARITKVLMAMEQGRLNEFKGKSLDQININPADLVELPDEETRSDLTDGNDTSELQDSMEFNEESDHLTPRSLQSTPKPQDTKRRKWTEEEQQAVNVKLNEYIRIGTVPGKRECMDCIEAAPEVLRGRDWQAVKYYVKNRITARLRDSNNLSKTVSGKDF